MAAIISNLQKTSMAIARKWQNVDETVHDEDALAQGIITPQMLELVMQIIMSMLQNCPRPSATFKRIQSYTTANQMDRVLNPDRIRTNWVVDRWLGRLGIPRTSGDVAALREAFTSHMSTVEQPAFEALQTEVLFMGI